MRTDLREARIRKSLTQEQVAAAIGRNQGAVSRYESGSLSIDLDTAPKLARVLGLPVLTVLYGDSAKKLSAKPKREVA